MNLVQKLWYRLINRSVKIFKNQIQFSVGIGVGKIPKSAKIDKNQKNLEFKLIVKSLYESVGRRRKACPVFIAGNPAPPVRDFTSFL